MRKQCENLPNCVYHLISRVSHCAFFLNVEQIHPALPSSPRQKYRLPAKGLSLAIRKMRLPIQRVTEQDVQAARRDLAKREARWPGTTAWDDYMREVRHHEQTKTRNPFDSNPFELYLLFGQVIKARSAAKQVFLIGKCGSDGYVPTERSEKAVGYSGGVNVGKIGHVGGFRFCEEVVAGIGEMFK